MLTRHCLEIMSHRLCSADPQREHSVSDVKEGKMAFGGRFFLEAVEELGSQCGLLGCWDTMGWRHRAHPSAISKCHDTDDRRRAFSACRMRTPPPSSQQPPELGWGEALGTRLGKLHKWISTDPPFLTNPTFPPHMGSRRKMPSLVPAPALPHCLPAKPMLHVHISPWPHCTPSPPKQLCKPSSPRTPSPHSKGTLSCSSKPIQVRIPCSPSNQSPARGGRAGEAASLPASPHPCSRAQPCTNALRDALL